MLEITLSRDCVGTGLSGSNEPIYITISTFTSVRPSGVGGGVGVGVGVGGVPLSIFKFLQPYHKVSLIKVA